MLSIFLIGVYVARRYFSKATLARVGYAALFAVLVGVLFHLRGYLGFSLGLGFLLAHLFSRFRLRWEAIFAGLVLYGMALYVAHTVGLLAPVAQYRGRRGLQGGLLLRARLPGAIGNGFFEGVWPVFCVSGPWPVPQLL